MRGAQRSALDPNDALPRSSPTATRGFVYVARKADPGGGREARRKRHLPGSASIRRSGASTRRTRRLAGARLRRRRQPRPRRPRARARRDARAAGPASETVVKDPFGRAIDVVDSSAERDGQRRLPDARPHDPGERRGACSATTVRAVAREERDRDRARPDDRRRPRDGRSRPGYDANSFPRRLRATLQRNRAVTDTYEPGSTFKLVTVAGALSERLVTPQTPFTLPYEIQVADRRHPRRRAARHGDDDASRRSSRTRRTSARSRSRELLGQHRLAQLDLRASASAARPGIDFPGESPGIVLPADQWSGSTIGNVPIGQGIAVTPIQMASAYAAIANGGVWVQPHLVDHVGDGAAPSADAAARSSRRRSRRELMAMLKNVVAEGTGTLGRVPGLPGRRQDRHGAEAGRRTAATRLAATSPRSSASCRRRGRGS